MPALFALACGSGQKQPAVTAAEQESALSGEEQDGGSPPAPPPPPKRDNQLDKPKVFGLTVGEDTSGYMSRALGAKIKKRRCDDESALERDASDSWFCFDRTKIKGATQVKVGFSERPSGLRLYAAIIEFPLSDIDRVFNELTREPAFGKFYSETKPGIIEWDWGYAQVSLEEAEDKAVVSVKTVLEEPQKRSRFVQAKSVNPWDVVLGHDTKLAAESKLEAAGFTKGTACVELSSPGAQVRVTSCGFENAGVTGLKYLKMELTGLAGEEQRVSELECVYDSMMIDVVRSELRSRYGDPLKGSPKDTPTWWTVPTGIFMLNVSDYLSVSYHHGRLHRIAQLAVKGAQ